MSVLHGLNRCSVVEHFLTDVLIIQSDEAIERCLKVFGDAEMVPGDDLGQPPIKPCDHVVGPQ